METHRLIRAAEKVKAGLVELPDGRLITTTGCKIQIPVRFSERGLAQIGMESYIIGIYAMIVEDTYYAVSTVNAMIPIDPTETLKIKVQGEDYYEFVFLPGTTVFKSVHLVKTDTLTYKIYDEIFSKGYIPWYLGYNDLGHIFDTAKYHAGANIGTNREVTELIVSIISRNPKDKTQYYRTMIQELADLTKRPPAYVALRDVTYSATNTLNRLGGSYMQTGMIAALNHQSDRQERIEGLLTK